MSSILLEIASLDASPLKSYEMLSAHYMASEYTEIDQTNRVYINTFKGMALHVVSLFAEIYKSLFCTVTIC